MGTDAYTWEIMGVWYSVVPKISVFGWVQFFNIFKGTLTLVILIKFDQKVENTLDTFCSNTK